MKLCLGTVQFGLNYGIAKGGQPSEDASIKMIECCYATGITAIDTAAAYGNAESIVGKFVNKLESRYHIQIASKTPSAAFEGAVDSQQCRKTASVGIKKSLKALQTDYLDFYLLHNSKDIFDKNIIDAMYGLKQEGLAKKIGVSIYSPSEAIEAVKSPYIDCIQIPYNVIDRRLDKKGFFDLALQLNKTIFCRSVLLQGLLAMDCYNLPQKVSRASDVLKNYDKLCTSAKMSKIAFAIGYIAAKKGIDYMLMGVDNEKQLSEQITLSKTVLSQEWIERADEMFDNVEEYILNPSLWGT